MHDGAVNSQERNARDYCHSIGADPDEMIWVTDVDRFGSKIKVHDRRWRFYVVVSGKCGGMA